MFGCNFKFIKFIHRLKICKSVSSKCVFCGTSTKKLKIIPNSIRFEYFSSNKIIIKSSQRYCKSCENSNLHIHKINEFNIKNDRLSKKWLTNISTYTQSLKKIIQKQQTIIEKQKEEIKKFDELHLRRFNNKYGKVYKNITDQELENELKTIPNIITNRYINNVQFKLLSNNDCQYLTGFTRTELVQLSQMCGNINTTRLFHMWFRIKHYIPFRLQAILCGKSYGSIQNYFNDTLDIVNEQWAKKYIIHGFGPSVKQFWTRETIKNNTLDFCKKLENIKENDDEIIVTMDSTYQYIYNVQTDHDIRKKTTNMHKHHNLLKVHIICCSNGLPIYPLVVYGDGHHADGVIFEAMLDKQYLQKCQESINNGEAMQDDDIIFKTQEIVNQLKYLQSIIQIQDHCICDNGYKVNDPRIKAPLDAPDLDDLEARVTVLANTYKRNVTAQRNGQERLHAMIKQISKFCRTKIHPTDLSRVQKIWNLLCAYCVFKRKTLTEDNEHNKKLADRIIDMRHVAINPCDWYYTPKDKQVQKKYKKQKERINYQSEFDEEMWSDNISVDEYITDDYITDEFLDWTKYDQNNDNNKNKNCAPALQSHQPKKNDIIGDWKIVAVGWDNIKQYIKSSKFLNGFFLQEYNKLKINDMMNFIGRKYQNNLAYSYLRRMYLNNNEFRLIVHIKNPYVIKFQNVRSKWRSSKKYDIVINFYELYLYTISVQKHFWPRKCNIKLQDIKERHWLKWLQLGDPQAKVSTFLSNKYKQQHQILTTRRINRIKKRKSLWFNGSNYTKIKISKLRKMAREYDIKFRHDIKKMELIKLMIEELKAREKLQNERVKHKRTLNEFIRTNIFASSTQIQKYVEENKIINLIKNDSIGKYRWKDLHISEINSFLLRIGYISKIQHKHNHKRFHALRDYLIDHFKENKKNKNVTATYTKIERMNNKCLREYANKHKIVKKIDKNEHNISSIKINKLKEYADDTLKIKFDKSITQKYVILRLILLKLLANGEIIDKSINDDKIYIPDSSYMKHYENPNEGKNLPKETLRNELGYLIDYPCEKYWFDIQFEHFNSKLARLQYRCDCRAGAQLLHSCAHVSACLWLIFYAIFGNLLDAIKQSKRDKNISNNVIDLTLYKKFAGDKEYTNCICDGEKDEDITQWQCENCDVWYHAECLNTTDEAIQQNKYTSSIWHCPFCSSNRTYTVRHV